MLFLSRPSQVRVLKGEASAAKGEAERAKAGATDAARACADAETREQVPSSNAHLFLPRQLPCVPSPLEPFSLEPFPRVTLPPPRAAISLQGYLAHEKTPLPYDHHRFLDIGLL